MLGSARWGADVDPFEQLVEILGGRYRDRAGTVDGALGHAGEHPSGAELGELGDPEFGESEEAVLPAHRAAELGGEQAAPHRALVVGQGVDVGHHRHLGVARVGVGDGLAQPVAGGCHEGGVEGARHGQGHDLLGAELLGYDAGRSDTFG